MHDLVGRAFGVAVAAAASALPGSVLAQNWPERPVTLIVPYAPGGNVDVATRVIAKELSDKLGQQFVVENKSGAGGAIASAAVAKAKPDGYTFLLTTNGPAVFNKLLHKSIPYDPDADFTPVALISDVPQVIVVNPKSPIGNLKDLVAFAKQKPTPLTFGHAGVGTGGHLAAIWLAAKAQINIVPVAYRGAAPVVTAVLGGEIDAGMPSYVPQVGTVKAIAVTAEQRVDFLPGVPTVRESGILDLAGGTFTALVAPAGLPREIVVRMNGAIDAYLKTDTAKKELAALGARPLGGPPEAVTRRMDEEKATWGPIVKSANIVLP